MKRKLIYLSILVLLVLFACSQKENKKETVEKEEKKILTMAQKAEIKTLDPQKATDSVSRSIIKLINQTLVYIDNEGNIVPELAQEITKVSPKETLIKIKNDIKNLKIQKKTIHIKKLHQQNIHKQRKILHKYLCH